MELPKNHDLISLSIRNLGNSGEGVGSYHGYTIFVEGALPGEMIEARLFECHKRYARAHLIRIVQASPHRVKPPCPHFDKCGGCQLMHLAYPQQLIIKQQRVIDALQRIGGFKEIEVSACLPSPSPLEYRNKIQLPARQNNEGVVLGLYARSSHELVEIDHCYIHCPLGEQIYQAMKPLISRSKIVAYDPATGTGELRHLVIKSAIHTGEALVILVTNGASSEVVSKLAKEIVKQCPSVKSVVHNIHTATDNVILGNTYKTLEGSGYIHEQLLGLTFKVSPASFFQVNPAQAECLYAKALEFAELDGSETVLDAYCGVGTLALYFAKHAKKVIGIECVSQAISDAKENAILNQIPNASFVCANAETYIKKLSNIKVALLNPPRKGCDPIFINGLKLLKPEKIVYVSCDPATLARDLALLCQSDYVLEAVQPYDMFPQTAHVECVAKVRRTGQWTKMK